MTLREALLGAPLIRVDGYNAYLNLDYDGPGLCLTWDDEDKQQNFVFGDELGTELEGNTVTVNLTDIGESFTVEFLDVIPWPS